VILVTYDNDNQIDTDTRFSIGLGVYS